MGLYFMHLLIVHIRGNQTLNHSVEELVLLTEMELKSDGCTNLCTQLPTEQRGDWSTSPLHT